MLLRKTFLTVYILLVAHQLSAGDVTIIDSRHYSNVFGEIRNFRVFLPPGYYDEPQKDYPVIYFLHGWSQRYFGGINAPFSDMGDSNEGDNIGRFVSENEVIVVKSDGYNRSPDEEYNRRPYNIGPVENHRQFPIYFPELIEFIDKNYNTIPDRNHRAITGLSMGGFMAFWIGGKYPHMFSAVGNFCGSPEFFVGPASMPVEYRHMDMYGNYEGMNVVLHYGNRDFIRAYHLDMNKIWTEVMDNYQYRIYDAEHVTAGLGDMFSTFMETFDDPPPKPRRWHHIDVYPSFSVWDYTVDSDRLLPGFTIIENVDERGFRTSVRNFLPDGELMPFVRVNVTTAPLYEKNQYYTVNIIDLESGETASKRIMSDDKGRLSIETNGGLNEIGIDRTGGRANPGIASVEITSQLWITPHQDTDIEIRLFNKGTGEARNISAEIVPFRENAVISSGSAEFGTIPANGISGSSRPYTFRITCDTVMIQKFRLTISDADGNSWTDYFEIPVKVNAPEITDFVIADGAEVTVARAGVDSITMVLGHGNGNGRANPGESFVILVKDEGLYRRTELYTNDPYVNPHGIHKRGSDGWGRYDNVGGSNKYSIPLVSSECPPGHKIEFFATWWLPDYPDHIIKHGRIKTEVSGSDQTPPLVRWVTVSGDNTIEVKLEDGSGIGRARARFISTSEPEKSFVVELYDTGQNGDRIAGDNVFSRTIPERGFGLHNIEIEAEDLYGNETFYADPSVFVLY